MSYSDTLLPAIISMADLSEKFDIVPEEVRDALSALGVRMMRGGTDADLTRWPARRVTTEPDGRTVIYEIPLIPDPEEVVVLTDALPNSWQDRLKRQQRMSEMLAEQASSEYQKSAAEVDSAYDALTAATDELGRCTDTMSNAPKTGDISKVREAKAAVAEAKQAVTDAEHIIDLLHGDDPAVQDIPVVQAEGANVTKHHKHITVRRSKGGKLTLEDFLMPCLVETFKTGTYRNAKELYKALVQSAGSNGSPFKAGTGKTDSLYVIERGQTFAQSTLSKLMGKIRQEAGGS